MGKVELIKVTDVRTALWAMLTDPRTVEETEKTALAVMNDNEWYGWVRDMENGAFRQTHAVFSHDGKAQGEIGFFTTLKEDRPSTKIAWRVEYEVKLEDGYALPDATNELASMVYDDLEIKGINYPESILFVDDLEYKMVIVYLEFENYNQFAGSLKGKGLTPLGSIVLKA